FGVELVRAREDEELLGVLAEGDEGLLSVEAAAGERGRDRARMSAARLARTEGSGAGAIARGEQRRERGFVTGDEGVAEPIRTRPATHRALERRLLAARGAGGQERERAVRLDRRRRGEDDRERIAAQSSPARAFSTRP